MTLFPGSEYAFPEAWESWVPTLGDVLNRRDNGTEKEKIRYADVGIDMLDWGSYSHLPKENLTILFNESYFYRRLAGESLEQWRMYMQRVFDEIAPGFDRAFSMYTDNAALMNVVNAKQTVTYDNLTDSGTSSSNRTHTYNDVKDQTSGTDTDVEKRSDTPDSAISESDSYADSVTKSTSTAGKANTRTGNETDSSTGSSGNVRTGSVTTDVSPEGGVVENLNRSIDAWRNLERDFVRQFNRCFKNVFWY